MKLFGLFQRREWKKANHKHVPSCLNCARFGTYPVFPCIPGDIDNATACYALDCHYGNRNRSYFQRKKEAREVDKPEPSINLVNGIYICDMCLDGEGGICNTPGCIFIYKTAPDLSIRQAIEDCGGIIDRLDEED